MVRCAGKGFLPQSAHDREIYDGLKREGVYKATLARATKRSVRQHNMFWGLMRFLWDHQEHYETPEALVFFIKIRLGMVDYMIMHNGEIHLIPQSIAFHKMDQDDFNEFLNRVVLVVLREILPQLDSAEVWKKVEDMLGISTL